MWPSKVLQPRSRVVPRGDDYVVSPRQLLAPDGGPTTRNSCVLEARVSGGIQNILMRNTSQSTKPQYSQMEKTHRQKLKKPSPEPFERTANSDTLQHDRPWGEPCMWRRLSEQNPREMAPYAFPANSGQFRTCRRQARENGR